MADCRIVTTYRGADGESFDECSVHRGSPGRICEDGWRELQGEILDGKLASDRLARAIEALDVSENALSQALVICERAHKAHIPHAGPVGAVIRQARKEVASIAREILGTMEQS